MDGDFDPLSDTNLERNLSRPCNCAPCITVLTRMCLCRVLHRLNRVGEIYREELRNLDRIEQGLDKSMENAHYAESFTMMLELQELVENVESNHRRLGILQENNVSYIQKITELLAANQ
jgi:hypothetical protein